jgi:GTP-binding protein
LLETWEAVPPCFITSSSKKEGKDEVLGYIDQINQQINFKVIA